jgi:hypothetical protein
MSELATETPNCWRCRHFAISYDPKRPYSCRLMGFKTKILPAIEVLRADGVRCMGFERKSVVSKRMAPPALEA